MIEKVALQAFMPARLLYYGKYDSIKIAKKQVVFSVLSFCRFTIDMLQLIYHNQKNKGDPICYENCNTKDKVLSIPNQIFY